MTTENIEQEKQEEQKKKRKKGLFILLLLLLLAGGGFGAYHFWGHKPKETVSVISGDFLPEGKDAKRCRTKN